MRPTLVRCPTCRHAIEWSSAEFRPFCSERCRLIDLGAWLTEKHAIPADASEVSSEGNDEPSAENQDSAAH